MSVVTGPSLLQIQKVSFVLYSIQCTAVQKKEKEKNNLFTTATLTAKIGQSCKSRYEYEFEFAVQSLQCSQGVALTTSRIYVVIRSLVSLLVFASGNTLYKITFQ